MAVAPYSVFVQPVTSVDNSTIDTLIFDQQTVKSLTANLTADGNMTAATVSSVTPTQLLASGFRNSFNVISPADGLAFYVGPSSALTPANGALISQGSRLKVSGYTGSLWVLGASGASVQMFYQTT